MAPELEASDYDAGKAGVDRIVLGKGHAGQGSFVRRSLSALTRIAAIFPILARQRSWSKTYIVTMTDWLPVKLLQFIWIRLLQGHLVYVVHDASPHAWSFPKVLQPFERATLRLSYHLAQQLVVLTHAARDELVDVYGVPKGRIAVIPHGAYESGEPTPMPGNNVVLLFGMLRRNKHILETIKAMAVLPPETPLMLRIAGAPHADDLDYWRECEVALQAVPGRIETEIGFVDDARVTQLLHGCDALILPYENFNSASGVASLGAFAERLLIATDAGSLGELVKLGLELVPIKRPVTASSIAAALMDFAALPLQERRDMALRSRHRLAEQLSWGTIGSLYCSLLTGSTTHGQFSHA